METNALFADYIRDPSSEAARATLLDWLVSQPLPFSVADDADPNACIRLRVRVLPEYVEADFSCPAFLYPGNRRTYALPAWDRKGVAELLARAGSRLPVVPVQPTRRGRWSGSP